MLLQPQRKAGQRENLPPKRRRQSRREPWNKTQHGLKKEQIRQPLPRRDNVEKLPGCATPGTSNKKLEGRDQRTPYRHNGLAGLYLKGHSVWVTGRCTGSIRAPVLYMQLTQVGASVVSSRLARYASRSRRMNVSSGCSFKMPACAIGCLRGEIFISSWGS